MWSQQAFCGIENLVRVAKSSARQGRTCQREVAPWVARAVLNRIAKITFCLKGLAAPEGTFPPCDEDLGPRGLRRRGLGPCSSSD
jgi:hypothetical protein